MINELFISALKKYESLGGETAYEKKQGDMEELSRIREAVHKMEIKLSAVDIIDSIRKFRTKDEDNT